MILVRTAVRRCLESLPWAYLVAMRARPSRRELVVTGRTDVVVEGFPRSANTFTVCAIRVAFDDELIIGRHLHSSAQLALASQYGVPALVLIRNPLDAVASLLVRDPRVPARQALRDYARFYRSQWLRPSGEMRLVAFEAAVAAPRAIVRLVQQMIGDSRSLDLDDAFERRIEHLARMMNRAESAGNDHRHLALPDARRRVAADQARSMVRDGAPTELHEARMLYESLRSATDPLVPGDSVCG